MSLDLLRLVLFALTGVSAVTVAALFGHGLVVSLSGRARRARLERGRSALISAIVSTDDALTETVTTTESAEDPIELLKSMPLRAREELVLSLARNLEPTSCGKLADAALQAGLVARAGGWCRSRWWWRRLRGARLFCAIGGGEDVMVGLLRDRSPPVRALAAEWAAAYPSPVVVSILLERIDDPAALSRFAVQDSLLRLGHFIVQPLVRLLEQPAGPQTEPALHVASAIPHPQFVDVAVRHCAGSSPAIRAAAARLLGAIGGPGGTSAVTALLSDADASVRAASVRALGRMGAWTRAPTIAERMRDPSWEVRRAAGLTLRDLGSPGLLVLRRMLSDRNRFAADMARLVLDLPGGVGAGAT